MSRPELGFEDRVTIGGEGGWPLQERAAGIDKTKGKLEGKPVDLSCLAFIAYTLSLWVLRDGEK